MRVAIRESGQWPRETVDLARTRLEFALGRFAGRVRSVSVSLTDLNGPRGGLDKKCLGLKPVPLEVWEGFIFVSPEAEPSVTLEEYLGVQLFRRYNRAMELTDVAKAALPKLGEGFDCLAAAVAHLRSQQGGGSLTVSAAPSFASRWLMPRLHRFIAAHPEIDVRISARMRRVSVDGKGDVAERATVEAWLADSAVAILYGRGNVPGIKIERLIDLSGHNHTRHCTVTFPVSGSV